jgi:hypothetical protein
VKSFSRKLIGKFVQRGSLGISQAFGDPAKFRHFVPVSLNKTSAGLCPEFISPCSEATSHELDSFLSPISIRVSGICWREKDKKIA